ncbi:MAG: nucleotide pyrophosphohydrolase [Nanohaloarchaea archaeon SW_7_43_1]|nr:MAG: nucleotide pyrophosphohydrolase [Nanohaloarchaea archaeon SW_7_43_1]
MEQQEKVAEFVEKHNMQATSAFRIMDLVAEVGEIASDATKSADYGESEEELRVEKDELGDALFSLISVANDLGIDLEEALDESLDKYESRIEEKGDAGSE